MWVVIILVFAAVALAIHYWYVLLPGVVCAALLNWAYDTWAESRAERADRLQHERARQTIAYIEMATARAMRDAARETQEVIDSTAVEVRRHD